MKKYTVIYYFKNQSREFSDPYSYSTDNKDDFFRALKTIFTSDKYDLVDIITK